MTIANINDNIINLAYFENIEKKDKSVIVHFQDQHETTFNFEDEEETNDAFEYILDLLNVEMENKVKAKERAEKRFDMQTKKTKKNSEWKNFSYKKSKNDNTNIKVHLTETGAIDF